MEQYIQLLSLYLLDYISLAVLQEIWRFFKIDENLEFFINFRELRELPDFLNILENQFNLEIFENLKF